MPRAAAAGRPPAGGDAIGYTQRMSQQQIAVKLPDGLLRAVDELVGTGTFESRSQAVRHALEGLVLADRRRLIDDAFAAGFAEHPDTDEKLADATRLAIGSIADEPWEKWW